MTNNDPTERTSPFRGPSPRLVVGGLVVAAVVAFVVQNTEETDFNWLFLEATQPLWVVLLVTAAATLLGAELIAGAYRRRRRKDD